MNRIHTALLLAITILAAFLRVFNISDNPPSLSWDEVSIGYNAYSILKTGSDEHGQFLPLDSFTAYGDYKPPLSVYVTVPFVAVFGLNETAVRLPSAVAGTVAVVLSFIFTYLLFQQVGRRTQIAAQFSIPLGLITAFLMAVSPWHVNLSRAGFEATIAHTLYLSGAVFILQALRKPGFWTVAFIPFILSMYTFNSARYASPIIIAFSLLAFRREVISHVRFVIVGAVIAIIALFPLVPHLMSPEARLRFTEVNIFSDASIVSKANERIAADGNQWWAKFIDNRRAGYLRSYLIHFFDNLEPWFLFVRGDGNPKFSIQDVGQMYLAEAPFFAIGFFALLVSNPAVGLFLICLIAAAVAPAAVARETPHALRIMNSLPAWQMFTAFGILWVLRHLSGLRKALRAMSVLCIVLVFGANIAYYIHNYYVHYPMSYSGEWQYGYREAIRYVLPRIGGYDRVVISDAIGRPYMYTLFYTGYDPARFRSEKAAYFDAAGFYHVDGFGKFQFTKIPPEKTDGVRQLVIGDPSWAPEGTNVLETIRLLNGNTVLSIFEL